MNLTRVIDVLAWTLLHSVWQLTAAWLLNYALQHAFRRAAATIRYVIAWAMLLAGLVCVAGTAGVLQSDPSFIGRLTVTDGLLDLLHVDQPQRVQTFAIEWFRWAGPAIVIVWLLWTGRRLVIAAAAFSSLGRLRRHLVAVAAPPCWERLTRQLTPGISVMFAESFDVLTPAVIGWLKPVVIVPVGFLSGNSPFAIEAVLAHELAHIRRRDYLVNLALLLIESVFWFHPSVSSLACGIGVLREKCCDGLAIASINGKPVEYAEVLLHQEVRRQNLMAIGIGGGSLKERVLELLSPRHTSTGLVVVQAFVSCVLLLGPFTFTGRTVASTIAVNASVVSDFGTPLSSRIYEILNAGRPNPQLVPAMTLAVRQLRASGFDEQAAKQLAGVLALGCEPDDLLDAAMPTFTAAARRPRRDISNLIGDSRDWDQLAILLLEDARAAEDASDRLVLARASIILAAQERINTGGFINVLVRNADLPALAQITPDDWQKLLVAVSADAMSASAAALKFHHWKIAVPSDIPDPLASAAAKRPAIQWLIANYIYSVSQKEPARASHLIDAARARKGLTRCVELIAQ